MKDNRLAARITRFIQRLKREDVNMHGFILSIDGQEKVKAYYAPFQEGQPHRLYSVSKTLTGIAIGMLIEEGKLRLEDPITPFFPDYLPEHPDGRLLRLTIRDMLRMSTCYRWTAYREGVDENWARSFFTGTPTHEPGTVFSYDTGCSQVLAALVLRLSGQQVIDYLQERLFLPLGATDEKNWLRDPSGCCQGGTGLCMSLRDMHAVAQCILDGGRGIIPAWYAREMGKKQIETLLQTHEEERYGYGWQCWRTRSGFAMYGLGGQLAVICPEKKAVLSTIADTRLDPEGVQRIYNAFFEEIDPYIGVEDMEPVSLQLSVQPLPDHPEGAVKKSGFYVFEGGNPLQLVSMQLKKNVLSYENARGPVTLPLSPGNVLAVSFPGWPDVPALVSSGWVGPGLLRVRCHAIGQAPCGFDMLLSWTEDASRLTVLSRMSHDPVTEGYDGVATGTLKNPQSGA